MTKKRLSYDLGAEYLKTSDGFEDDLTDRLTAKSPEDKNDLAKVLRTLLDDNLTKKQKCYIILYYREGLTVKEIAEKCGVDKSTVSRTINRGRQRMAKGLSSHAVRVLLQR
ncbi:sigma-70 family RNA polymerase sigma factor [Ruminococcus sp.]|uniref:sigma-70 family RNA polymerase sigma factor n=1 Tax=Ruminococcus sp. TaxID=41978 RepID=UPI0025F1D170|nr:sigma-70 family RNA polymerase sigma factor [Ruminococcus sp.]MBQ8966074.1 sigma-70 family RNA polymerase sigma factor [Ruminococcus sp.]